MKQGEPLWYRECMLIFYIVLFSVGNYACAYVQICGVGVWVCECVCVCVCACERLFNT